MVFGAISGIIFYLAVWAWNTPSDEDCDGNRKKGNN